MFNRIYRLIWSQGLQAWVAVSENTRGRGKQSGSLTAAALSVTAALLLLVSPYAHAGPEGGQVVSGSGSISASGATTTINQASDKLSINWQSFNVAKAETVNFVQPSASALAVNRIFDTQGSQILGRINANGQVWLINPNGVMFGKDAQINVGGLLASTLNPDDASIGSTRSNFSGSSTASVVNLGSINTTQGGYVAMLGHSVSNQGSINAPGGTVAMGAGSAVSLNFEGSKLLGLEVTSNQMDALAENGGVIQADGGQVLLSAGARESLLASVVNNTGGIQARTVQEKDGKIILLGGMAAGTTNVKGTLDASAPNGGNGGFIETSAYTVNVDDSASITTASAQGKQGQWLIDPNDFYIAESGGNITGTLLSSTLGNTDVTIQTVASGNGTVTCGAGVSCPEVEDRDPNPEEKGDIYVNDTVTWSTGKTLTLNAWNSIYINKAITAKDGAGGKLALVYGQASDSGGNANYFVNAKVFLQAGENFSTKLGRSGTTKNYTVITNLGSQGDQGSNSANNSLQGLAHSSRLSRNFVLGDDINAGVTGTANNNRGWNNGAGFSPIGLTGTEFTGTFDGLGHTITGLFIKRSSTDRVGMFGTLGTGGVVQNVGLVNARVTGKRYVGGLVGYKIGTVNNSYVRRQPGQGDAFVTGTEDVGGLVGWNNSGGISSSYAAVRVNGSSLADTRVGGLVGRTVSGTISSSYATGDVTGSGHFVGGLVGYNAINISDSYASGVVTSTGGTNPNSGSSVGGLVGLNAGEIRNSYATGSVTSEKGNSERVGGLVGRANAGSIIGSYATGRVKGVNKVGGLVGENEAASTISSSYAYTYDDTSASVSGTNYIGGLVGQNSGSVSDSYAEGTVTGTGGRIGGLVGWNLNNSTNGIKRSYATGNVSGSYSVGGLVGYNDNAAIENTYATGKAHSDTDDVGGLVGYNDKGSISSSYATGLVTSSKVGAISGGFVGQNVNGGTISGSFFDKGTTGQDYGVGCQEQGCSQNGVTALNSAQMKESSYFSAWSISSDGESSDVAPANKKTWRIYDGFTAPLLRTFLTHLAIADKSTTYNTAVQHGNSDSSDNIWGTAASGTNAGRYKTNFYSNQKGWDLSGGNLFIGKANLTKVTASKTYDGLSTVTFEQMTAIEGVNGESFRASAGTAAISDKNVATANKTLTDLSNLSLASVDGSNTSNYDLDSANLPASSSNAVTITPKAASVSGTRTTTTYSGLTQSQTGATTSGFIEGDNITVSGLASGKNADTYTSDLGVGGTDASNYSVTITNADLVIDKADAVVTANSNTSLIYNGFNQTVSGFTASGLQGGETENVLTGVTASITRMNAGTYSTTASGTDGNYNLSFVDGLMVIAEADLTEFTEEESSNAGTTSTSTQIAAYVPPAPVVDAPPLPSDTSYVKAALPAQNTQPFSRSFGINTLFPTGAGTADNLVNLGPQGSAVNLDEKLPDCESEASDSACGNASNSPSSSTSDAGSGDTSSEAVSPRQISQR